MAENNASPGKLLLREYQVELLEAAKEKNIIVCLGTGTGKTFISIKLIEHLARIHDIRKPFSDGGKRTFFLVNSVPLVYQQAEAIRSHTTLNVKEFCGEMGVDFWSKDIWLKEFENNHVLVMTHQIYLDLLKHAKLRLSQTNLLVFDECHHANKNHPFKQIMDRFEDFPKCDYPRILGLTASVVCKKVKPHQIADEIKKLERTLRSVCKTASDPNIVEKYGAKPKEFMKTYSPSSMDSVALYLEKELKEVLCPLENFLQDVKVINDIGGSAEIVQKELTVAKSAVRECSAALEDVGIWAAYEVSKMLIDDLEKRNMRVTNHLASLLLQTTMSSLRELGLRYKEFGIANGLGEANIEQNYLKPKVKELLKLFTKNRGDSSKHSIVFVERRYAACVVSKLINRLASEDQQYQHLKADFVTGHGSELWGIAETEMKFKAQQEKLRNFRKEEFNVLVGTSVVEEGVDIPKCNLVIMFDFPKNYRAFVQSRGRGRAKEAEYVLLVKQSELSGRKSEQEMYKHVDKYLTELCQRDRDEPTEEDIDEVINVYAQENYYTNKNARLDMPSSISLLYRYCSKLPCDRFTQLKPRFTIYDVGHEFQCKLKMPGNSHVTGVITGDPMLNKKEAKQAVALKVCKMLHEKGALNDNLLPEMSSSESEDDDGNDETDGSSKHKTGTKKRLRKYVVKTSKQLYGVVDGQKKVYVYAIVMKFDEIFNQVKKNLWDRKNVSFAIITNEELPKLSTFSLYNDIGKLNVQLERCRSTTALTPRQRDLIDWFHIFIFTQTLEFKLSCLTTNGCRLVLLNSDDPGSLTESRGRLPVSGDTCINFHEMELLRKKALESDGKFSSDTDLLDSVVIQHYLQNPGHFMVTSVTDQNPCSLFPDPEVAATFKDYHEVKYHSRVRNASQPLIKVINHSRKIDYRSGKSYHGIKLRPEASTRRKKSKFKEVLLIPETLKFRTSPQSLTLRALFLPTILYRVDSLVSMSELRARIDLSAITSCYHDTNTLDSPRKRLKLNDNDFHNEEGASCVTSGESYQSTLSQYFYPFDSSKSVPLFKLLEAVTCASSGDDFNLERLEMLGDSFLKMAVSVHVYWHKNIKDEGKLTKYRTRQISNKNLFQLATNPSRNLTEHIKHSGFSKETWLPPGFTSSQRKLENGYPSSCSDDDSDLDTDEAIGNDGHDVMEQQIPDKSVADSMEALIGAHLIHCGYMGALGFMTWLGVRVFHSEDSEDKQDSNGRRKSPIHQCSSKYANYPLPTFEICADEDKARYEQILVQQTTEMASFEKKIKYEFKNKVLLLEAFSHPTFTDNTITGSYQRLEFLGDAILDFLVTVHIYNNCEKDLKPGELTDLRSALVNNNIFAVIAVNNDYHKYLKEYSPLLFTTIAKFVQGVKELDSKVIRDPYVMTVQSDSSDVECIEAPKPLGDVFESVAGAIFLDSGLDVYEVWRVCYPMLKDYIDEYSRAVPKNPLRMVKELDENASFSAAKIKEDGRVSCELTFKGQKYKGTGRNKHVAKLSAAHKALPKK